MLLLQVTPGHIRVEWHPRGDQTVVRDTRVHLADRSIMPGDVVRRYVKGKDTQRGIVRDMQIIANAHIVGTDQVSYIFRQRKCLST